MSGTPSCLHATVRGRVQGVGFRWFIQSRARSLGLTGFVRNLANGSVEVSAEGPRNDLEILAESVRNGPDSATIESVSLVWEPCTGKYTGFDISPTR